MLEEALTLDDFNWLLLRHARLVHVFVRVVCVLRGAWRLSVCMMRTRYCWLLFATYCVLARTAGVRAVVYGIVSCGGVMDIAGGAGGGIIGVDGGRRGRTGVGVVRVCDLASSRTVGA